MQLSAQNPQAPLCSEFLDGDPPWRLVTWQGVAGPPLHLVCPLKPEPQIAPV